MSKQVELRAGIPEEMADPLEDYFCETESPHWGIMQKEVSLRTLRHLPRRGDREQCPRSAAQGFQKSTHRF